MISDLPAILWLKQAGFKQILLCVTLSIVIFYVFYIVWEHLEEKRSFDVYTAMNDLSILGTRSRSHKLTGTAVIAGGGLTGLLAARVCADHFERVVVLEPDEGADTTFPAVPGSRRRDGYGNSTFVSRRTRIPQTFHVHVYRPFALLALRRLFRRFDQRFAEAGGVIKPWAHNSFSSGMHVPMPRDTFPGGRNGFPAHREICEGRLPEDIWLPRAHFEPMLRRMITEECKVEFVRGTVTGLKGGRGVINEVVYKTKARGSESTAASLVVGHSKAGVKWLESSSWGYGRIPQETYDPRLRYATMWFQLEREAFERLPIPEEVKGQQYYLFAWEDSSLGNKAFWLTRGEGYTILLAFGGYGIENEELPRSPEDVKEFYRGVRCREGERMPSWYYDVVDMLSKDGGWERAIYDVCKVPPCVFVKYHEVGQLPANFVALGDAVMRTSPVYGLGVTKGFVGAVTLAGTLDLVEGPHLPHWFGSRVFKRQEERTGWAWSQTKEADYGYPTTIACEGETLEVGATARAMTSVFLELTKEDEEARARYYYARLYLYPNSIRTSKRIVRMCLARLERRAADPYYPSARKEV